MALKQSKSKTRFGLGSEKLDPAATTGRIAAASDGGIAAARESEVDDEEPWIFGEELTVRPRPSANRNCPFGRPQCIVALNRVRCIVGQFLKVHPWFFLAGA